MTSPWASALGEAPVADAAPAIGYAAMVAAACLAGLRLHAILLERDA